MSKPYVVKQNEYYCTWEEDISVLDSNTVVLAGEGTKIIHYVNGVVEDVYDSDNVSKKSRLVVNTRKTKKGDELVVGVNSDKEFSIPWGVGGVPFTDRKLKMDTFIGMNGEFKFKILHHPTLIGALGKTNIIPKDVKEFTAAKLQETLVSRLAARLQGKRYEEVVLMQSTISQDIQYDYEEELKSIGIKLTSFSLKEIFFPDDYIKARKERASRAVDELAAEEEEEKKRKAREQEEAEAAKILNLLRSTSGAASQPQQPSQPQQSAAPRISHYCPSCGKEVSYNAAFCDRCGTKLN